MCIYIYISKKKLKLVFLIRYAFNMLMIPYTRQRVIKTRWVSRPGSPQVGRPGWVAPGGSPQVRRPGWVAQAGSPWWVAGLGRPGWVAQGRSPRVGRLIWVAQGG